ncbi:WXG100 family type VII secretion target [Actinokineospora enzanensis]|uniref:WXG100 family type VII secretion target n=1 Tax=Actinokineospora enzanensis TaxID=155975 RepID=UPI0003647A7D|nr:PPE domain-containing protein [Actinokineospora enzanensis]
MAGGQQQGRDEYVTAGYNWESCSLEQLVKMVTDQASAPQLERLADDWRAAGTEVVDAADVLSTALDELMNYWSGSAAEQARHDVALNAQWVSDLGETAKQIGDPIQEAAGALKAAQDAMPDLPTKPPVPPAQAADSAARALQSGGPLVSAISGTAAGTQSAFTAEQEQAKLKAMAVEAMKRFEGAAIGIDRATPAFEARDTVLHEHPQDPGPALPPPPQTPVSYITDIEMRWAMLTANGSDPGTAVQSFDNAPGHPGTGTSAGYGGSAAIGGAPASGDARPLGVGGAVGATEALASGPTRTFSPGNVPAAASTGGAGSGTGMGGGMPMGAGGMGGHGDSAGEHRRRYPYDAEDPFALDQKASPPVIGL